MSFAFDNRFVLPSTPVNSPRRKFFAFVFVLMLSFGGSPGFAPDKPAPSTLTAVPYLTQLPAVSATNVQPTLEDLWMGRAVFALESAYVGLPMGESDTIVMPNGEWRSYLHASYRNGLVHDQCGAPVEFPGCVVLYRSLDGGFTFKNNPPVCQIECKRCPCESKVDHIEQQQYPRVVAARNKFFMTYEWGGRAMLRRSNDGLNWSEPEWVFNTGVWKRWLRACKPHEAIGAHPFVPYDYECLAGGPSGIFVENDDVYIFVGMGQNPGAMGCFRGKIVQSAYQFKPCRANPLFTGVKNYGPRETTGAAANPFYDFRMSSSADVVKIGERYYLLYEGVRGPGPGDVGDNQFALAMARSQTNRIDAKWERFPGNPLLVDLPGNIGLGHADLVLHNGKTILFTSVNGYSRSRFVLVWK
jgi:hypothetical protein